MELKPKGISAIEVAGQPVRLKVALKLLDAILTLSSIVVMVKDLLGSARSVGNHKAQIGAQRTDFNFNDNFSVFGPASGSVPKAINPDRLVPAGILAFGPLQPALGSSLKHRVSADTNGIKNLERFQARIDCWRSRAGIGAVADLAFRKTPPKGGDKPLSSTAMASEAEALPGRSRAESRQPVLASKKYSG